MGERIKIAGGKGRFTYDPEDLRKFAADPNVKNPVRGIVNNIGCYVKDAVRVLLQAGVPSNNVYRWRDEYLKQIGRKACTRCGGTGYAHGGAYKHVENGVCFKCGGVGTC